MPDRDRYVCRRCRVRRINPLSDECGICGHQLVPEEA